MEAELKDTFKENEGHNLLLNLKTEKVIWIVDKKCLSHTSYLSQTPQTCLCKEKLPGVNFYRFNAKNWRFFTDLTRKIGVFFTDLTRKIGVLRYKFYSPKIVSV